MNGCNSNNDLSAQTNQTNFSKFKTSNKLIFSEFVTPYLSNVSKMVVSDSVLIIKNGDKNTSHFFFKYLLEPKKLVDSLIVVGSDSGQMLSPLSIGINNNFFWAHDVTTKKITTIDNHNNIKDFLLKELYYNVGLTKGFRMYANGDIKGNNKIEVVDLISGEILDRFGNFNDAPSDIPINAWKMASQSLLFLNPSEDKLVLANRYTDKIEIFNLANKSSKIFVGPENFKPMFNSYHANGLDLMERNESTRFAFTTGYVTNDYIYLVFSGEKEAIEFGGYGKYICIYNWDGLPLQQIKVPFNIGSVAVNNDKEIYLFDMKERNIKKAFLNIP